MLTLVFFSADGSIYSVRRCEELPDESELSLLIPEEGFYIDVTGQKPFDETDILDIHNGYKADAKKKKLVKIK